MEIRLSLPEELQKKIENVAADRLKYRISETVEDSEELDKLIKDTIKGQIKSIALLILQILYVVWGIALRVLFLAFATIKNTDFVMKLYNNG